MNLKENGITTVLTSIYGTKEMTNKYRHLFKLLDYLRRPVLIDWKSGNTSTATEMGTPIPRCLSGINRENIFQTLVWFQSNMMAEQFYTFSSYIHWAVDVLQTSAHYVTKAVNAAIRARSPIGLINIPIPEHSTKCRTKSAIYRSGISRL